MSQPECFGRYEVERILGRGAMGVVYLAEDPVIGRQVAIKVIQAHVGLDAQELEQLQARFEREFKSAGTLSHPNIVTIHDVGQENDCSFIAMEFVKGEGLDEVIASNRVLSFKEIADLTLQISDGLDYAHERGVIHRDIKPANIIITREGRPKITDFGIAKVTTTTLTRTGTVIGTPSYMSPEQVTGHPVTGASDQFSVAVMTYQLLTGERPFIGDSPTTIMYKIVHEEPVRPKVLNARLPEALDRALMRALDKDPAQRYPSCSAFAEAVRDALGAAPADATVALTDRGAATVFSDSAELPVPGSPTDAPPAGAPPAGASAPFTPSIAESKSRAPLIAGIAAVALIVGSLGIWAVTRGGGDSESSQPTPTTIPAEGALPGGGQQPEDNSGDDSNSGNQPSDAFVGSIEVVSQPPGATIMVDGIDRRLVTPSRVQLRGTIGDSVLLELVRNGNLVATKQVVLNDGMESVWDAGVIGRVDRNTDDDPPDPDPAEEEDRPRSGGGGGDPVAVVPETYTITSNPSGAQVFIDGEAQDDLTPVEIQILPGQRYQVRVDMAGYETASWAFTDADLNETHRNTRELLFNLGADTPPGTLVLTNAPYPVEITATRLNESGNPTGRAQTFAAAQDREIDLASGLWRVELSAPNVYFHSVDRMAIQAEVRHPVIVPRAVNVRVRAYPANCRISIDGRYHDSTPFGVELVIGEHEFRFDWSAVGEGEKTVRHTVAREGQQIAEQSGRQ
jgi:serine/threonine protein kinase